MRIIDWSSDVCSSDLIAARFALGGAKRHAAEMGADAERYQPVFLAGLGALDDRLRVAQFAERHLIRRLDTGGDAIVDEERPIGRGVGTDRGWKNVKIRVGAEQVKKQNKQNKNV